MLRKLTCPWFVNFASSVKSILVKNKSSVCSFRSPHLENYTFRRKSSPLSSGRSDMWYGWNLLVCRIRRILRWLIPLLRSSCLELICGLCATAAKMPIACRSSVAYLSRLRFCKRWSRRCSTIRISLSIHSHCCSRILATFAANKYINFLSSCVEHFEDLITLWRYRLLAKTANYILMLIM